MEEIPFPLGYNEVVIRQQIRGGSPLARFR